MRRCDSGPCLPEPARMLARWPRSRRARPAGNRALAPCAEAPAPDPVAGRPGLPAGAVVFAWRRSGVQDGPPVAVSLVVLDARGFPVREARSTVRSCSGVMFRAGDRGDEAAVTVEADDEGRPHANGWRETPWLGVLGGAA